MTRWSGRGGEDRRDRDRAAFLASEHTERRDPDPADQPTVTPRGTLVRPAPQPGERKVIGFSALVLFEVYDPPGYGYRLVALLDDGVASVWDLRGYTREDAYVISRTWSEYPETLLGVPNER